jgi:hypothetical protein
MPPTAMTTDLRPRPGWLRDDSTPGATKAQPRPRAPGRLAGGTHSLYASNLSFCCANSWSVRTPLARKSLICLSFVIASSD